MRRIGEEEQVGINTDHWGFKHHGLWQGRGTTACVLALTILTLPVWFRWILQRFPHMDFIWAGRPGILTAATTVYLTTRCIFLICIFLSERGLLTTAHALQRNTWLHGYMSVNIDKWPICISVGAPFWKSALTNSANTKECLILILCLICFILPLWLDGGLNL